MTVQINAFDPDNNGIGISFSRYLSLKFTSFDNVSAMLSTDTDVTEYAFIGTDGGGVIFHSSTGWTLDPGTGNVVGTLDSISFGQQTAVAVDGTFSQSVEMSMSGLDIFGSDLQTIFDQASDGDFMQLNGTIYNDAFNVVGSSSKDSFRGGGQSDVIHGGAGDDRIQGSSGRAEGDRLSGDSGNDRVIGSFGDDVIYGGSGDDVIDAKLGDDIVKGGTGNDKLYGNRGDDKLYGDSGDDFISGGRGEDRIYGGAGNDELYGSSSADVFVFEKDAGDDIITDFKAGKAGKDVILFHDVGLHSFANILDHAADTTGGLLITYDEGSLLLENVKLEQLDKHDFLFS